MRGSLALVKMARAWALLHGRPYVTPADVEVLFIPVLGHRLMLSPAYLAETRSLSRDEMLERIRARCLEAAPAPRPDWEAEDSARAPSGRPGARPRKPPCPRRAATSSRSSRSTA